MTNIELAQICATRGCYKCSEPLRSECIQNDCWKADLAKDCVCPAVYYGAIPKTYGSPRIDYEKVKNHLVTECGWASVTDVTAERELDHNTKRKPPFKALTIHGVDTLGNPVTHTINADNVESWAVAD